MNRSLYIFLHNWKHQKDKIKEAILIEKLDHSNYFNVLKETDNKRIIDLNNKLKIKFNEYAENYSNTIMKNERTTKDYE